MRKSASSSGKRASDKLRVVRLPALDKNIVVELRSTNGAVFGTTRYETREIGGALLNAKRDSPGRFRLARQQVFTRAGVSSYSIHPGDTTKIIKETSDGTKRVGRLVGGRFRELIEK
jgi:hypothetical protein